MSQVISNEATYAFNLPYTYCLLIKVSNQSFLLLPVNIRSTSLAVFGGSKARRHSFITSYDYLQLWVKWVWVWDEILIVWLMPHEVFLSYRMADMGSFLSCFLLRTVEILKIGWRTFSVIGGHGNDIGLSWDQLQIIYCKQNLYFAHAIFYLIKN